MLSTDPTAQSQKEENPSESKMQKISYNNYIRHELELDQDALDLYFRKILNLRAYMWQNEPDKGKSIRKFDLALKNARIMRKLKLIYDGDARPQSLLRKMKKLRVLKSVHLGVHRFRSSSAATFKKSRFCLNKFKAIKDMDFCFSDACGNSKLFYQIENFLRKSLYLQSLSLSFFECYEMTYRGFKNLWQALKGIKSLQKLKLSVESCYQINDDVLYDLGNCLKKLGWLKVLVLVLSDSVRLSDEGVHYLTEGLSTLGSLEGLCLNFSNVDVTDDGLLDISESLKSLTGLKSLTLNFNSCTSLTDRSLHFLGDSFKNLMHLKYLFVDFSSCSKLTDLGVNELSQGLETLGTLQVINMNFWECENITAEGAHRTREIVERMTFILESDLVFNE